MVRHCPAGRDARRWFDVACGALPGSPGVQHGAVLQKGPRMIPCGRTVAWLAAVILAALVPVETADAMRCDGSLVRAGDRQFQVAERCGQPDYVDGFRDPHFRGYVGEREIWYYNFGPHRFLRVLHFRDGRLHRIESAGRGFTESRMEGACIPREIRQGMSSYELVLLCGEPAERELRSPLTERWSKHGLRRVQQVVVEDWFYPGVHGYMPRRVRLEDGRVREVRTLSNH